MLDHDAANVGQVNQALADANHYTDVKFNSIQFDIDKVRRGASAGTAAAMAMANLPQPLSAGGTMLTMAGGYYGGQGAFAMGITKVVPSGRGVVRFGVTYDTSEKMGLAGGFGIQF